MNKIVVPQLDNIVRHQNVFSIIDGLLKCGTPLLHLSIPLPTLQIEYSGDTLISLIVKYLFSLLCSYQ